MTECATPPAEELAAVFPDGRVETIWSFREAGKGEGLLN